MYGEQSQRLDTCLVWYTVENYGTVDRNVGLRMMLDTFIGANDGVPFVIPGQKGLLTDMHDFSEKEIPDYIEAIENPDPANPGTVAHIGLKGITHLPRSELEDPSIRMLICRWRSGLSETRLGAGIRNEIRARSKATRQRAKKAIRACSFTGRNCLMMPHKGEVRNMAFTYGLGKMAASISGECSEQGRKLFALTAGGSFLPGGVFTVTAYVKGAAEAGQKIKVELPKRLESVYMLAGEDRSGKDRRSAQQESGLQSSFLARAGRGQGRIRGPGDVQRRHRERPSDDQAGRRLRVGTSRGICVLRAATVREEQCG